MPIYKVNLGFAELSDPALDAFTENVIAKLTGNGAFNAPPVLPPDLQLLSDEFTAAMAAAVDSSKANTIIKNVARAALVDALRKDALYVQTHGNNDAAAMLGTGFYLSSLNRTSVRLATPAIESIENGASTTLVVKVTPIKNAKGYDVQYSSDNGVTWVFAPSAPKSRPIIVPGLTPGTMYLVRLRAVGGATGVSDWCAPVSRMAT